MAGTGGLYMFNPPKKADWTPVKGTNDRVLELISHRLDVGQRKYRQDMQLTDGRDMIKESLEEILDACVYVATELIKLKDRVDKYEANGALGKDY